MSDVVVPFVVLGVALGGAFATSAVGLVVVYKATGVLNLAFGAIGALCALFAHTLVTTFPLQPWVAFLLVCALGGVLSLLYGVLLGPPLAGREPITKLIATLALMLGLLGVMSIFWKARAYSLDLPSNDWNVAIGGVYVNGTQIIAVVLGILVTAGASVYLRATRVGTAMRALSGDREITAMLGVRVRRIEAVAWSASGVLAGLTGLLLSSLVGLDATTLTFLVIAALAAALVGRLTNLGVTFGAAIAIGVVQSLVTPIPSISEYRSMTPFLFAIVALLLFRKRTALGR